MSGKCQKSAEATHPPIAAKNMSPRTNRPSSSASAERSAFAAMLAPAQNVATAVPTIHPDPVISPNNRCPFDRRATANPSETQSVTPVSTTMHPAHKNIIDEDGKGRFGMGHGWGRTILSGEVTSKLGRVAESLAYAVYALGNYLLRVGDRTELAGVTFQNCHLPLAQQA